MTARLAGAGAWRGTMTVGHRSMEPAAPRTLGLIFTRRGWERARHERRVEQRRILQAMPPSFSCTCVQCYCGGMDMIVVVNATFCRTCGRPREILRFTRK